jgi:hypothetical protein
MKTSAFHKQVTTDISEILEGLARGILPLDKTFLLEEIPKEVRANLFSSNVKFNEKVKSIKPFLRAPHRLALVKKAPTLEEKHERYDPLTFKVIEFFYCLRALVEVLPESAGLAAEIIKIFSKYDLEKLSEKEVKELMEFLTKLRGVESAISAVVAAASKIFFTIDGLAFDDFSVSLSAVEWEIIIEAMNKIRLDFAAEIKEKASVNYNLNTSKKNKIEDLRDLNERIHAARGPLLQIMKLNKEDLHPDDQASIIKGISLAHSNKKIAFDRKSTLALAKNKILEAYRKNPSIDIKKYAKEVPVLL